MTLDIILIVIILALLVYIIVLNINIQKKDIFIQSTLRRLAGMGETWTTEEMMKLLHEMRSLRHYSSFLTDKLFDEKPLGFLLENEKNSKIFIHYTKEEEDARNIIKEGFRFADSFYKTALPVSHDRLDLLIKHNGRKSFGDYLIVICLSEKIFNHYSAELDRNGLKGFAVENVLTEIVPYRNENADLTYLLSRRFIKGYINHLTGEVVANPDFNPMYDSIMFSSNIEMLKTTPQN